MGSVKRDAILRLAECMASGDMSVNGAYVNAPYTIIHDGERYIARLRPYNNGKEEGPNISYKLVVEKPITYVGEMKLS
jgi:hypothetical protein